MRANEGVAPARLAFYLLLCSLVAAIAAGLLLGMMLGLLNNGPAGLLSGLILGMYGAGYGLLVATIPAFLFGALLWLFQVRPRHVWATVGALAGLVCYGVAFLLPGNIGEAASFLFSDIPIQSALAFAIAGALAAMIFRVLMRSVATGH